jgi:hypothetical protein
MMPKLQRLDGDLQRKSTININMLSERPRESLDGVPAVQKSKFPLALPCCDVHHREISGISLLSRERSDANIHDTENYLAHGVATYKLSRNATRKHPDPWEIRDRVTGRQTPKMNLKVLSRGLLKAIN